ncbi:MAG: alpha/beta fold hydrolase [Candidatus Binatia bacterium]
MSEVAVEVPRHDVPLGGRSGFAVIEGRQVHYLEWGRSAAPAVLCLHGGGQTAYMYEELGNALPGRYHLLAPDLPDHGDSEPTTETGRHALAATLPPLCAHFGLSRFAMVGASLGGIVSITYAAQHAEQVAACADRRRASPRGRGREEDRGIHEQARIVRVPRRGSDGDRRLSAAPQGSAPGEPTAQSAPARRRSLGVEARLRPALACRRRGPGAQLARRHRRSRYRCRRPALPGPRPARFSQRRPVS